ncbi:MAG: hypothetical protein A2527_12915 [Candidatus Lambdaproteobacteria bacterium RIFOXYD2_FULL_50_16]|uniref:CASTOR/POLLUX/SYM8 ion channel conserved domain-containing protein n=1 Tax=Candidatus Lambdaproteobacteria bacterium RIFOXYD2_FULL_50_16 TaxID=1817772 RepID=A0A1F6G9T7_9PROT|nr:MAG: hypothetical protein A2527_12915 [Candidatus Lambdaproteobacteria bacterium RIFOXYD2_FULL_50_16]
MDPGSYKDRFRYRFDNFFAKGGWAIFQTLISLYIASLILMGGLRILVHFWVTGTFVGSLDQLWAVWLQIMDIGGMENDSQSPLYHKAIGIATSILGLMLISTMLAFVTSVFKEKLEDLRKGKSKVLETNHTVILGFGIRALEIIRELVEANDSEPDSAVVVLSETDKEVMDDFFNDLLTERGSTRVITRSGSVTSPYFLRRNGVSHCKSVLLLNPAVSTASPEEKNQADYWALKSIMAIFAAIGEDTKNFPPVVAQLHYRRHRELAQAIAPDSIFVLDEETILSKILVQTSRSHGLSLVYSNLVGFVGNEVYFSDPPPSLLGTSFGDLAHHFIQSVPLGISDRKGKITINPPMNRPLQEGDELIILAEDDSTIKYYPEPPVTPVRRTVSNLKASAREERFLLFGWSHKSSNLIKEYAGYLSPGSVIDVRVKRVSDSVKKAFEAVQRRFPDIRMSLEAVNTSALQFPATLKPETYDNVIILAGNGDTVDRIDAETIGALLKFRHYIRKLEERWGKPVPTKLISEVMDSENLEIIQQTGVKDFLISNQFISKIMAQISEEPRVKGVYEELFRAEGSEIYLKPVELYLEEIEGQSIPFADLVLAAQTRGETCFGVSLHREESDPETAGVYIIPRKDHHFQLEPGDRLIVLAKDDF